MGSVYRATAPDGRAVAAKLLLDEKHAARFEIEGRLLARLDHPRVVKVLGTVFDPSGRYLMMEWVDGEDLAHVLRREGTPGLTEDQVIKHTLEAAEALRYVHEQQTIHRDVKPQNLMLSPERGVVLVDFGIARDLSAESMTEGIGTPGYMAPEAFTGGALSPRTDVYGLAMTAWTLLTSVPARYASVRPPEGTSEALLATIDAALVVDPERRLPSMQAFADGLGGHLPTERGRDIGVSAAVGEATARVLSAIVKTAAGVFDAAATSVALRRPDAGLDYQAAWGAGRRRGRRHAPEARPGHRRPRARDRRRRGRPGLPRRPGLRRRDRAQDRLRALHDARRAADVRRSRRSACSPSSTAATARPTTLATSPRARCSPTSRWLRWTPTRGRGRR